jgi:hypothetical protein
MRFGTTCVVLASILAVGCAAEDEPGSPSEQAETLAPDAAPAVELGSPADLAGDADAAPPAPQPPHLYGEFCLKDGDCQSSFCFEQRCTAACDLSTINSCRLAKGFCVPMDARSGCTGSVDTGRDVADDAFLSLGHEVLGKLTPSADADFFEIHLAAGKYDIGAQPGFEGSVRVEVYSAITKSEAVFSGAAGVRAHGQLRVESPGRYFVVVRDVTGTPTSYTVRVTQN